METTRELLAQGKLNEARVEINEVLARDPRNVDALLLRSTLFTRQGELPQALNDAEEAVRLSKGSPESQLRRAISLWRMQQYGKAKCVARWLDDSQAATMWKGMIAGRPEAEEQVDAIPKQDKIESPIAEVSASQRQEPLNVSTPQQPRMDWYQSDNVVHITLYRKGLEETSTDVRITDKQLTVSSTDFKWSLPLGLSIVADSSTYEITPYKVEFSLQKKEKVRWASLDSAANNTVQTSVSTGPTPQTSYSKWEHIEADDEDEKKNSDPNAFFQELYKSSTPEVQRAMMKSFVESNGTALSTNWDEVKKGKVETQPPKDMEVRDWN